MAVEQFFMGLGWALALVIPHLAQLCGIKVLSSSSANTIPALSRQQGTWIGPLEGFWGSSSLGKATHHPKRRHLRDVTVVKGVMAAVPGYWLLGPSLPALLFMRCLKHRQLWMGNLVLHEKHKTNKAKGGCFPAASNASCPALRDQEDASKSNFPPILS